MLYQTFCLNIHYLNFYEGKKCLEKGSKLANNQVKGEPRADLCNTNQKSEQRKIVRGCSLCLVT